jgi:hypothetical protein
MPKLHELLAAESNIKTQATKLLGDLTKTFADKRHLFGKKVVTFIPNSENATAITEEQSELQTTVPQELAWLAPTLAKALDAAHQIAESNMAAKADVTLDDGTKILSGVPATSLLELEKKMTELHGFITAIPTLDPAKGFTLDPQTGENVFKARETVKTRTKKITRPLILHPPTEHHPAQVQAINEDVPVGEIREQEWSGLITPAQKAAMLGRVDELRRALKTARARANDTNAATTKIGSALLNFVFQPATERV